MSQHNFGNLESPLSGTVFINTHLEPWRNALHSLHSGISRPSYAIDGMQWWDSTTNPWLLKAFDGSDDTILGEWDRTTNQFYPSNTDIGDMQGSNNLSELTNVGTARSNLGLGSLAVLNTVGTTQIDNDSVTYEKIQNVSAQNRVLARKSSGAGDAEETTLSELLDFIGSAAQGDILYRGASAWLRLAAGTAGQFLKTQGAGADIQWGSVTAGFSPASVQTLSGTEVDFTGIPSTVNAICITITDVTISASTIHLLVQIGDSGGIENTGYVSHGSIIGVGNASNTTGFDHYMPSGNPASSRTIWLVRQTGNKWVASHTGSNLSGTLYTFIGGGTKTLSGTLDRVRITLGDSNSFTGGSVNIMYL